LNLPRSANTDQVFTADRKKEEIQRAMSLCGLKKWQWMLHRALGIPTQQPPWFAFPVMRRIAISTPNVMAALRRLNRDQARPYNFALSPVLVNLANVPITLLGPSEKDSTP
jgi:hypothetical protein